MVSGFFFIIVIVSTLVFVDFMCCFMVFRVFRVSVVSQVFKFRVIYYCFS
jgi:hypothetical protein